MSWGLTLLLHPRSSILRLPLIGDDRFDGFHPRLDGWEEFDELHFISFFVVLQLIDQAAGDHDAESAFAQTQLFTDLHVTDRVARPGRVRKILRVETGARVAHEKRILCRVQSIRHRHNPVYLLLL